MLMLTEAERKRQDVLLDVLELHPGSRIADLMEVECYAKYKNGVSRTQIIRGDLNRLKRQGKVTITNAPNSHRGRTLVYSVADTASTFAQDDPPYTPKNWVNVSEPDSETSVKVSEGPAEIESAPDSVWSLEELLVFVSQAEGLSPGCFRTHQQKAVAAVRAAIDARDRARKGI